MRTLSVVLQLSLYLEACDDDVEGICQELRDGRP